MKIELIYSPDDAAATGCGWYWQSVYGDATSQLFATEEEARRARQYGKLKWEE